MASEASTWNGPSAGTRHSGLPGGRTTLRCGGATVRFEARDLKPYAEPMSADELVEGEVYFAVRFIDEEMLIPTIDTLVFIGRDLDLAGAGKLYFQDIDSYLQGVRYATASEDDGALFMTESAAKPWIFRFEQALEQLLACSLRRKARGK
jgi:hypothetical protein